MWFLQKKEIVKIEIDETVLFDLHHKKNKFQPCTQKSNLRDQVPDI